MKKIIAYSPVDDIVKALKNIPFFEKVFIEEYGLKDLSVDRLFNEAVVCTFNNLLTNLIIAKGTLLYIDIGHVAFLEKKLIKEYGLAGFTTHKLSTCVGILIHTRLFSLFG